MPTAKKSKRDEKKLHKIWKVFSESNLERVEKESYISLLEYYFLLHLNIDEHLKKCMEQLKKCMTQFWKDDFYQLSIIRKKDYTHTNRVLYYLDKILFPMTETSNESQGVAPIFSLNQKEIFVLLCATYLHDYGKGQFKLSLPGLVGDSHTHQIFEESMRIGEIHQYGRYGVLEECHAWNIHNFLNVILSNDLTHIKNYFKNNYKTLNRCGLNHKKIGKTEPFQENLTSASAQQCLVEVLLEIYNKDAGLLQAIQEVAQSHKAYKIHDKPGAPKDGDFFKNITDQQSEIRIKLLASLLRLADNLDLNHHRLERNNDAMRLNFKTWMEDYNKEHYTPEQKKLFAKWLLFELVEKVEIEHRIKGDRMKIDIIIAYRRFSKYQKYILTVRSIVEKDFFNSEYLNYIESAAGHSHKVKIRLLYKIEPSNGLQAFPIEGAAEEALIILKRDYKNIHLPKGTKSAHDDPNYYYGLISPSELYTSSCLRFSELNDLIDDDFQIPGNAKLLALIGILDNYRSSIKLDELYALGGRLMIHSGIAKLSDHQREQINNPGLFFTQEDSIGINKDKLHEVECFLKIYYKKPLLVKHKIREIEELGYMLPFSYYGEYAIYSNIHGFNNILRSFDDKQGSRSAIKYANNILIVGGPGTGKTTFMVQLLKENISISGLNVMMFSFEEPGATVENAYKINFNWEVDFINNIQLSRSDNGANDNGYYLVLENIQDRILSELPDFIAIDGLSRLSWMYPNNHREISDRLFKFMSILGIPAIFSIEEPLASGPMEEYQADGVIHLYSMNDRRELMIEKLRGQYYTPGRHAFEILDKNLIDKRTEQFDENLKEKYPFEPGINIYPNEQYYATKTVSEDHQSSEYNKYLDTGIENLNRLLPGGDKEDECGYRRGNAILVLGSPGAGKTIFGLHFLKAHAMDKERKDKGNPVLWLSFEGHKRFLHRSIESFDESVGFDGLLECSNFIFYYIPPAIISPEFVFYYVIKMIINLNIQFIVIDSVSEIEETFEEKARFRQYMTTFIHELSQRNVTSMLLSRVPGFFQTSQESESEITTFADTIISIKTFDIKNQIRRGLFVLKSRGRELRSQLQTMDIIKDKGIVVSDKGWELQSLLSGRTGDISEPEVFLKHFYENPAEDDINEELKEEFKKRYPDKIRAAKVRKPAIYSEFWSFRGHFGAGHANIRVVSISRYMVEAFREIDRLDVLDDFFPDNIKRENEKDYRWYRYKTGDDPGHYDSLPIYSDIGFLVYRKDLATDFFKILRKEEEGQQLLKRCKFIDKKSAIKGEVSWEFIQELIDLHKKLKNSEGKSHSPVFALPPLDNKPEFIAFFFELLWSKGGDIYHFPLFIENSVHKTRESFYKNNILLNKPSWERFLEILESMLKDKTASPFAFYTEAELKDRISTLNDTIEIMVETPQQQNTERNLYLDKLLASLKDNIKSWLKGNEDHFNNDADIITINNRYGRDTLSFMYDMVYESADAVPNPYVGDYRSKSIFSRCWYSQIDYIQEDREEKSDHDRSEEDQRIDDNQQNIQLSVHTLPYFEEEGIKQSCAYLNVCCLSLIKDALSPEIGWLFIDTLSSKEWVRKRARKRLGFPYWQDQIKSMEHYDPDAFKILKSIHSFNEKKRECSKTILEFAKKHLHDAGGARRAVIDKDIIELFSSNQLTERDIGDILHLMNQNKSISAKTKPKLIQNSSELRHKNIFTEKTIKKLKEGQLRISELSDFDKNRKLKIDRLKLYPKSKQPAHRPFFHRVESILHKEISSLFSPEGRRGWYKFLMEHPPAEISDTQIDDGLKKLLADKNEKRAFINRAMGRIEDLLIFEIYTAVPDELRKQWDKTINTGKDA